jgi:gliding motility-associated-like protein
MLLPLFATATHVVGGSITYEHLGGATYRITLKMYRDCRPGNSQFPGSVGITVRDSAGNGFSPSRSFSIPFTLSTTVQPYIDSCAVDPGLCLEEAIYTRVVNNLPPQPGGYHLFYQYCCRNYTLVNVNSSPATNLGETWYCFIPDNNDIITNSSPTWVNPPPVFVCQAQPIDFDFSATDLDGDSLVYSFYTPYEDDPPTYLNGQAIFPTVTFLPGFGVQNPTGGANLNVDPNTGWLSGSPPFLGQFVAGIKCEEFRNGNKIGEILRDFQLNVVFCPPIAQAVIGQPQGACTGNTVTFNNIGGSPQNGYFWDFGDLSSTNDTSSLASPTYTYPGQGPYTVTLIINPNTPCADTGTIQVEMSTVTANTILSTDTACVGQVIGFTDSSTVSGNAVLTGYYWDFGDNTNTVTPNPSHAYGASGTYTVTHIAFNSLGCNDTTTTTVQIIAPPIALAGNDTFACTNNAGIGLGGSVLNVSGGIWIGAGTFTPSNTVLNSTYAPTQTELDSGYAILILQTTGLTLCGQDQDTIRIDFTPGPTIDVGPDIFVCIDTPYINVTCNYTLASGIVWSSTGTGSFANPNAVSTSYTPTLADRQAGSIIIYAQTTGNGNCLPEADSLTIFFTPPPNITLQATDTACSNQAFPIVATSQTGAGYWTTLGDGTFPGGDSVLVTTYLPGANDLASGTVALIFNSLNNGGCQQQRDTLFITIIPAPNAAFTSTSTCPEVGMPFVDQTTSVSPITNWNWNFGDNSTGSTQQNPSHVFAQGGWYAVELSVISVNGCVDTVIQQTFVYPAPDAEFVTDGFCLNEGTLFIDSSVVDTGSIVSWSWDFGDNNTSTTQSPLHEYASSNTWNVSLVVTTNFGCVDTVSHPVLVYPSPTAAFTSDPTSANILQNVNFTDQSYNNVVNWTWDFGDTTQISTQQNPSHTWINSGTYQITLVVVDTNGCPDTLITDIIISTPPSVPSGFSPNGDGQNDIFIVRGGPFPELEMRIYNNWGELIFVSTSQQQGWDGTRDGIMQPEGVFVYTVRCVTYDKKEYVLSGDVTLVR